ncbi:MAG TPA: hypothetical protein VGH97_13730 [Thermoanaerobaculia bacterium]|jgi:hypothetical protein
MTRRRSVVPAVVLLFTGLGSVAHAQQPSPAPVGESLTVSQAAHRWVDADGKPMPFETEEEILEFLRTADVVADKTITSGGITMPRKVQIEKNGVRSDAIFRVVNESRDQGNTGGGRNDLFFRDSYVYEPAAYELSRMLGLDNVPPSTLRTIKGTKGSIQIWLEHAMTDEKKQKENIQPPDDQQWQKQLQIMNVFDALIFNTDRNKGNILIDQNWKLWMIDHTRAFRRIPDLMKAADSIKLCERNLYNNLKNLDEAAVRARLKDYLTSYEFDALFKRRKMIVDRINKLIADKGEDKVLYTFVETPAPAPAEAAPAPAASSN